MSAIAVARYLFRPEIIHCHDWQTALVPVYMREHFPGDPTFSGVKTLFTIHNLGYQGIFGPEALPAIGLDRRLFNPEQLEFFGKVNFLKGGIAWSDAVSTVSKAYAREIQTAEHGAGLDGVLRHVAYKFRGILNGIDVEEWDPAIDSHLDAHFELGKLHGKTVSKRMLAKEAGLKFKARTPMLAVVSRLVDQKGFQLLLPVFTKLLRAPDNLCSLSSGSATSCPAGRPEACSSA